MVPCWVRTWEGVRMGGDGCAVRIDGYQQAAMGSARRMLAGTGAEISSGNVAMRAAKTAQQLIVCRRPKPKQGQGQARSVAEPRKPDMCIAASAHACARVSIW